MIKIKPSDILKGAGTDWMQLKQQVASTEQLADMRKPNPQMPTRTRGGGYRQPGIGENALNDFAAQGNGEVVQLKGNQELSKNDAEKIAAKRAGGLLPEQVVKTPIDRTQRTAVSVEDVADPVHQSRVNRLAGAIQGSKLGPVDSYDKMLDFLGKQQQADADADSRARRREMFAAIGDGISALSSLYQTTQGAPVTYTPGAGMSEVMHQRYDRMTAQRKADSDKYLNYLKMQHNIEQDKLNQEYRRSRAKYYEEESARKANESEAKIKREDDIAKAKQNLLDSQSRKADADTIKKRGENQYAVTYWKKYAEYRETMDHEEADRRANADAAVAEQEVLNNEENRKERKTVAAVNKANRTGSSRSKKSGKSASSNTPPSRRSGNTNNNNVRPSQRK